MAELLFEIGTEELPAGYLDPALDFLRDATATALDDARLTYGEVTTEGTPRRLVLRVTDLADRQPDREEEVTGPKASIAWGDDGALSKAGQGFLRGQGAQPEDAFKKETDKGEVIACRVFEAGQPASQVLPGLLEGLLPKVPFAKAMRWTDQRSTFGRPVRWLLALLDDLALELSFNELKSGDVTYGHRFHHPEARKVENTGAYEGALGGAAVVLKREDRRAAIAEKARALAESVGGRLVEDEGLLEEVANLVEKPWPVLGRFDERFLEMPRELLISEMREHQRYFAIEDDKGALLNAFVVVAGSEPPDAAHLAAGNTRVLRSRFEDGAFYFDEDRKIPLADRRNELTGMVFQRDLGTVLERCERIEALVAHLAGTLGVEGEARSDALRAGALCKADLVTGVVGEFPELQGIMGRDYALHHGEPAGAATAIEEHYWPLGAHGEPPRSKAGALVALADRLDVIVGILGIGKAPSGSADPFGLRRAAIGVARICLAHGFSAPLGDAVDAAANGLEGKLKLGHDEVVEQAKDFLAGRVRGVLDAEIEGARRDLVDAVMGAGWEDLIDARARAEAIAKLRREDAEGFEQLAATFKRVANILKKARADGLSPDPQGADPGKLTLEAEKALLGAAEDASGSDGGYDEGLQALIALKPHVDKFFDDVMVMTDDEGLRDARLGLLARIEGSLEGLADFTRMQVDG
jgi:glycyl-tRNA synthetase beta chain